MYSTLSTPSVIVDLDKVEANIRNMSSSLLENGISHRPHIKTHKSVRLAKLQLDAGAIGITVAKISEAEVFAGSGIEDILIAYSIVGDEKLKRFSDLHKKINVMTTVDSEEVALGLSDIGTQAGRKVKVLIELDGGLHRGGRQAGSDITEFASKIQELPGLEVVGIMAYFGQIYDEDAENITNFVEYESTLLEKVISDFKNCGISTEIISSGSTPSSNKSQYLGNVTEVRAGNYIFCDVSAIDLEIAKEEDCALHVIATVISTPLPGMATIDAGSKTLTSDQAHKRDGFGIVAGNPDISIVALNEEHGYLRFDPNKTKLTVGDRVKIIPNHACVIPNLCDEVTGVRGEEIVETISINARGKNK